MRRAHYFVPLTCSFSSQNLLKSSAFPNATFVFKSLKCAVPHCIFRLSLSRRSSTRRLAFVSITKYSFLFAVLIYQYGPQSGFISAKRALELQTNQEVWHIVSRPHWLQTVGQSSLRFGCHKPHTHTQTSGWKSCCAQDTPRQFLPYQITPCA